MAYDQSKPFTYGIKDGTYKGKPTTASFYEHNGRLILDIKFAVWNEAEGRWFLKENGYEWEAQKRHWITNKEGGFNEAIIDGLKEWAKGWACTDISSFYWFQQANASGVPFGNLADIGEVELNFQTAADGSQTLWVHDPNRPRTTGRKAFTPEGAVTDQAAILAKWGAKAKAVFAAQPRKIAAVATPKPAPAPTARPAPAPVKTPPKGESEWAGFSQTADGAFAYFCSLLGEPYSSAKHDDAWFGIVDKAVPGKDPDQFTPQDVQNLFAAVKADFAD